MENKYSLNEVDDFIRKFKSKNKIIKNNSQVIQKEVESEQKMDQSYSISDNKFSEKEKSNLLQKNEPNDLFKRNRNENEIDDVNYLFTSKPDLTPPQSHSQSQSIRIKSPSSSKNKNFIEGNESPLHLLKEKGNYNEITNEEHKMNSSEVESKEEVHTEYHIPSITNSVNVNQEMKQLATVDKLHQKKETLNKELQTTNKSTSQIIVHNNPFEDDPDEDPSALFESKEEIPTVSYTSSLQTTKRKLVVPQAIINRNQTLDNNNKNEEKIEQLFESNSQLEKSPIQSETKDNISNDFQQNLQNSNIDVFKQEEATQKEQITQKNDIKFPQFAEKTYQKPSQYAKPPIINQQRPNIPLYQRPQVQVYSNERKFNEKEREKQSSMENIYANFSNEFQAKTEVFQSDIINKEIERLDEDDDDNINLQKENLRFRTNSLDYPQHQREIAIEDTQVLSLDNDRTIPSPYFSNTQISHTTLSHGNIITTSTSKLSICSHTSLLAKQEKELYLSYFPISYSEQFNFSKIISYLETLQSITSQRNITSSIAIYLELMLLRQRMKLSSFNIFAENNFNVRSELIQMIKSSMKYCNYPKGFFDFNTSIPHPTNRDSGFLYSNPSLTIEQMKDSCSSTPSISSLALFSIISNQDSLNGYLLSMFDKGMMNKNSYWYILLILKSGQINKLLQENSEILFDNFAFFVLILLENYPLINNISSIIDSILKSNDSKLTYLHYTILFFLQNSFCIKRESLHGKLITTFLNMANIQKVILCDVFNYFCYCLNENLPKVIAKSSILIKFKYTLIKLYDSDSNVVFLGKKINENYIQFGQVGRNRFFKDYLMTSYVKIREDTNNNEYEESQSHFINKSNQQIKEEDSGYQTKEVSKTQITSNNNLADPINKSDILGGGIVSSLFSTLGLGLGLTTQKRNTDNQPQGSKTYTQEELNQMPPEEQWKINHPNEEEIYYDKEKKRYVLRGKIYDDQEEVIQQKEKEKPFVPPPKFKKANISQNSNNNNANDGQNEYQQTYYTNPQYKTQLSTISNPFNSSNPAPNHMARQSSFKQKTLTNRYAVGYQQ